MNPTTITKYTDLHALLDSLTYGQTVTATWEHGDYRTTITGPVELNGTYALCERTIRYMSSDEVIGDIVPTLTSFEATVEQSVTITRDDPAALLELVKSLTHDQKVTAEWRSKDVERATIITGPVLRSGVDYPCIYVRGVGGEDNALLAYGDLLDTLYSVTATVARTVRWEREA